MALSAYHFFLSIDSRDIYEIIIPVALFLFFIFLLKLILPYCVTFLSIICYAFFRLLSCAFSFLNGLQRHLSKPWRVFYKNHHGSDGFNKFARGFWFLLKIPLYFLLTPLRFVNAAFYNIIVHGFFEFFNYFAEIVDPTSKKEGGNNFFFWILLLPWRIIKYGWHCLVSFAECFIWTFFETIIPTLTLYHGTNKVACDSICQGPGRVSEKDWYCGVWNVGSGDFAGKGIYFAPMRSTAQHYAGRNTEKALIICRVSLGRVIDLGMAPKRIYAQCGSSGANVTKWGLDHGYTTGEWWRWIGKDGWWEYCMYDWQNRYNSSWRIRPLYAEDLNHHRVYRIRGGMAHWLFRKMVIGDIIKSVFGGK